MQDEVVYGIPRNYYDDDNDVFLGVAMLDKN
jgi:hypothetical protein